MGIFFLFYFWDIENNWLKNDFRDFFEAVDLSRPSVFFEAGLRSFFDMVTMFFCRCHPGCAVIGTKCCDSCFLRYLKKKYSHPSIKKGGLTHNNNI